MIFRMKMTCKEEETLLCFKQTELYIHDWCLSYIYMWIKNAVFSNAMERRAHAVGHGTCAGRVCEHLCRKLTAADFTTSHCVTLMHQLKLLSLCGPSFQPYLLLLLSTKWARILWITAIVCNFQNSFKFCDSDSVLPGMLFLKRVKTK